MKIIKMKLMKQLLAAGFLFVLSNSSLIATEYVAGDLAPRGAPDGILDVADALVLQRFVNGIDVPTALESQISDIAPLNGVDGQLNVADVLLLQRAIRGEVSLPAVAVSSPPVLDSAPTATTENPFTISGTATPNISVNIYVNGVNQYQLIVPQSGSFAATVYLYDGQNQIYATEFDGVSESASSNELLVDYQNTQNRILNGVINQSVVLTPGLIPQPYIIDASLTVEAGASLIVQPGTEIRLAAGVELLISGSLEVRGTSDNPVIFTRNGTGNWLNIRVAASAENVLIDHAIIGYASNGVYFQGSGVIRNSELHNNANGIYVSNASPEIIDNYIHSNNIGIYFIGASTSIVNGNVITENTNQYSGNGGLFLAMSNSIYPQPVINNNEIFNNAPRNINTHYFTNNGIIPVIDATGNWWGTTDLNAIDDSIFDYTETGEGSSVRPIVDYRNFLDASGGQQVTGNYILGRIAENTTLTAGTYTVLGNMRVLPGVTLTMEAGVVLEFTGFTSPGGRYLDVYGGLLVNGNSTSPVTFKKTDASSNSFPWGGVRVQPEASDVFIDHARVEGANTGFKLEKYSEITNSEFVNNVVGILIEESDALIDSNTLWHNDAYGLQLKGAANPTIINNSVVHNGKIQSSAAGIRLEIGSTSPFPYPDPVINNNHIYDNIDENIDATSFSVTSNPGEQPLINARNNWWGSANVSEIASKIQDASPGNTASLPYVDFSGYYTTPDGSSADSRAFLLDGIIDQDTTISAGIYVVLSNIYVPQGVTLALDPGVQLYFITGATTGLTMNIHGGLIVNGTESNRVKLTSEEQGFSSFWDLHGYEWDGVRIFSDATNVNINYAEISYAGNGIYFDQSAGSLTNSIISNNVHGVYLTGDAQPIISGNTIIENIDGIYLQGSTIDPSPSIFDNDIYGNSGTNLYLRQIDPLLSIDIHDNWWGSAVLSEIVPTIYPTSSTQGPNVPLDSISTQANHAAAPIGITLSNLYLSPVSSPGVLDVVAVSATLGESSSWQVNVQRNGVVVRSFTGSGTAINFTWDGQDAGAQHVADGRYSFIAQINGNDIRSLGDVFIDNTPPVAQFDTNLFDAILEVSPFSVVGTSFDINFMNYQLDVADGVSPLPADYRSLTTGTNIVRPGTLMVWPFGDVNSVYAETTGDKTLRLTVTDQAGNASQVLAHVSLQHVPIFNVTKSRSSIIPTDGETVDISFQLDGSATVFLRFYPEYDPTTNNLVAEVSATYNSPGTYVINWDGMGLNGAYLPDGAYRYELYAEYSAGVVRYNNASTNTSTSTCAANAADADVHVLENDFLKFSCTINEPSKVPYTIVGSYKLNKVYDVGQHTFFWDGRDNNGKLLDIPLNKPTSPPVYGLRVDSVIIKGNEPVLTAGSNAPSIEIVATPHVVFHSFEQISNIMYRVDQDSYVTITILKPCRWADTTCSMDPGDPSAFTLVNNQLIQASDVNGPIDHQFEWRGYDYTAPAVDTNNILVEEEGAFTFNIEATSVATGLTTTYRGFLNLYH